MIKYAFNKIINVHESQLSLNDGTLHDAKIIYQAMITSTCQTPDATYQ